MISRVSFAYRKNKIWPSSFQWRSLASLTCWKIQPWLLLLDWEDKPAIWPFSGLFPRRSAFLPPSTRDCRIGRKTRWIDRGILTTPFRRVACRRRTAASWAKVSSKIGSHKTGKWSAPSLIPGIPASLPTPKQDFALVSRVSHKVLLTSRRLC